MSEVDKEASVEKEIPVEPAEVKEEPVETQLPCEQPEDKDNENKEEIPENKEEISENKEETSENKEEISENKEEISEKKKKKKKKSKKKPTGSILPELRCIGGYVDWYVKSGQTADLQTPLDSIFGKTYPSGRIDYYVENDTRKRITDEEARVRDLCYEEEIQCYRKAAEVHREARSYIQGKIKPGMKLYDICCDVEDRVRHLITENGPLAGMGFPTGCSINNCAAHYTPNPGDDTVLNYGDVVKFDFGTQVNGYIIDSAFTIAFDPEFDELLLASKEATYAGVREAGVDARLGEIGGIIEEVITSHEVTIRGRTHAIQPVRNLSGHTVAQGTIHAGKSVPLVREKTNERMLEGEVYAIETFATTGQGMVIENGECSHFALIPGQLATLRMQKAKTLLAHIRKTFGTLPFCPRWLVRPDGGSFAVNGNNGQQKMYHGALRSLVEQGVVRDYLPLCDHKGSYVSQWEHTLILKSHSKEVLSWGTDY